MMVMQGNDWVLCAENGRNGPRVQCVHYSMLAPGAVPESHLWALVGTALVNKMTGLVLEAPAALDQPVALRPAAPGKLRPSQQWQFRDGRLRSHNERVVEVRQFPGTGTGACSEVLGCRPPGRPLRWRFCWVPLENMVPGAQIVARPAQGVPARAPPQKQQAVAVDMLADVPPAACAVAAAGGGGGGEPAADLTTTGDATTTTTAGYATTGYAATGYAATTTTPIPMGGDAVMSTVGEAPIASPAAPQDEGDGNGEGAMGAADDNGTDVVVPGDDEIDLRELTFDFGFFCERYPEYRDRPQQAVEAEWPRLVKEGRWGSPVFDVKFYLEKRGDLQDSLGPDNYEGAYKHFLENCQEECPTSRMFDWVRYRKRYKLWTFTPKGCFWHYMHRGRKTNMVGY